jgi:hypothetical protein
MQNHELVETLLECQLRPGRLFIIGEVSEEEVGCWWVCVDILVGVSVCVGILPLPSRCGGVCTRVFGCVSGCGGTQVCVGVRGDVGSCRGAELRMT